MLSEITQAVKTELDWGLDGIISPDRVEMAENVAAAVVKVIRDSRDGMAQVVADTDRDGRADNSFPPKGSPPNDFHYEMVDAVVEWIGGD